MSKEAQKIIMVGAGGQARVIIDCTANTNLEIVGIIDINYSNQRESIYNYPVLGGLSILDNIDVNTIGLAITIGNLKKRYDCFSKAKKLGFTLLNIVHKSAIVSKKAKIGTGVFINAGVIINADVIIGDNTIINTGSILDHEVIIGKHSHVGPGVNIGGRTTIGDSTSIGIGSCIIDKIKVGRKAIIGAGSVIIRDVEPNSTVVGVPGRRIK